MTERWRDRAVVGGCALLAVLVLGPALGPGYALVGDMVFVPDQSLLPWMLGLGGGLPRAVPQDAVLALLTGPVPGWVWQSLALLAALILLGTGTARLVRPAGRRAALVAAALAVWSPYVAERLLIGHWSLLLAVALLPWALVHARAARDGGTRPSAHWLLVVALASLTVTGGLLVLLVSLPVLLWRGGSTYRSRGAIAVGGLLLQLPWLVPALLHPGSPTGGADVFALRPEGPWGSLVTALGTGGLWNAAAVPGSRGTVLAPLLTVAVLALAWYGRRKVGQVLGRPVALTLLGASVVGLTVALLGVWWPAATDALVLHVPGGGLLRDGQKWLAPWLVLLSASAGCGAARLGRVTARRSGDLLAGAAVVAAAVLLPLACLPDLVWGGLGRLATVDYPDDWRQVRTELADDPAAGDVVALPWSTFRVFDWNRDRTVLDPAPRFMPRTVVTDQDLVVSHDGALVVVPGDDPRAARIGAALRSGNDVAATLRREGIGWVLVERTGDVTVPAGAQAVVRGSDLDLYRLPDPAPAPPVEGVAAVVVGNLAALLVVVGAALAAVTDKFRSRRTRKERAGATGW